MTIFMLFTIGFKPLNEITSGDNYVWAFPIQDNLLAVFMPFPIFFAASMIAYLSVVNFLMYGFLKKYQNLLIKNFFG